MEQQLIIDVFPTHVGMNRDAWNAILPPLSIPHARGDEPQTIAKAINEQRYSPRTWG